MIEDRFYARYGWTPQILYEQDADLIEDLNTVMDMEAVAHAESMKDAEWKASRGQHG